MTRFYYLIIGMVFVLASLPVTALELDETLPLSIPPSVNALPEAPLRLPGARLPSMNLRGGALVAELPDEVARAAVTQGAMAELAHRCSVRQSALALPLGALSPGAHSEAFSQARAFQVACPEPASYRLIIVNAQGEELPQGVVPVRIGDSGGGQLHITIDGREPGGLIRHNGVLPKTHQLAVELRDEFGRGRIPSASGVLTMAKHDLSLVLRPALPEER
ncbi:hypothetical protein [Spongiibacter marinus]|uniref:hypothetical protein n=1 Tax=Spongiibacter marinus TaxID=354246 RepID=UPI000488A924|nr:hypothetical protein [Spongiibacter marinus]